MTEARSRQFVVHELHHGDRVKQGSECDQHDDHRYVTAATTTVNFRGLLGRRARRVLGFRHASPDHAVRRKRGEQHEQIDDGVAECRACRRILGQADTVRILPVAQDAPDAEQEAAVQQ